MTAVFFASREDSQVAGGVEVYSDGETMVGAGVESEEGTEILPISPDASEENEAGQTVDATTDVAPDEAQLETEMPSGEVAEQESIEDETVATSTSQEDANQAHTTQEVIETEEDAVASETFNSTTVEDVDTPFFAEGDQMVWPVNGEVIVPYTDDTTRHWLSTALNQTMRTYGICIAAEEGTAITAPATATVVDIVEDATTLDWYKRVGDVGQVVILEHGNGYQTQIGVQGGKVDKSLLGQTIEAGTQIATVGAATGPFVDLKSNVYMQVRHDEQIIDPSNILGTQAEVAEAVDMGHSEE